MRRTKKKPEASKSVSPQPTVFHRAPEALKREISTDFQRNYSDDTLFYGEDDALPLRIAKAIDESPAASSCIDTIAQFIKGGGFSNPELGKIKIDKNGTTLWDFHCALADTIALYNGFAVNFKYNDSARITNSYILSFESVRFKKPPEEDPYIHYIAFNPYFGTDLYNRDHTKTFPVWDPVELKGQLSEQGTQFPGQVYYWGKTSPLYRFYPVPKYWTGKKWIYIDGRIQEAHAENLDNGWFQSVLMNVIGDPNQPSQNPKYIDTYPDPSDGAVKQRSTKTVGEEFSDQMQATFSGSKKMGTVQVMWSLNHDDSAKIESFPTNANADLFLALQDLTTKNITIATRVPSILANISEGVSLGSAGSEIQKAVELMQSRTAEFRTTLENFYNDILLPNLAKPITEKISIVNFNPISEPIQIDDKFWAILSDQEKRNFIKKTIPSITLEDLPAKTGRTLIEVIGVGGSQALLAIISQFAEGKLTETQASNTLQILFGISQIDAMRMLQKTALPVIDPTNPVEEQIQINDNLKNLTGKQQQQFLRIIRQFGQQKLTQEQASILLKNSFGFTDQEVLQLLGINDTEA